MDARQSLPRIWLVTDERQGDGLLPALNRLPSEAGILFRHYSLSVAERRALFEEVRARARAEGQVLLLAGSPDLAAAWGADGWHGRGTGPGFHSASVHNRVELELAEANEADLIFLGPVFPTRSHPGGEVLGLTGFRTLAALAQRPVIALGGIAKADADQLERLGAHGWAAVDAWIKPSD